MRSGQTYTRPWRVLLASLVVGAAMAGCERVAPPDAPAPAPASPWDQAQTALQAGEPERAAELFGEALAQAEGASVGDRRRRAAVSLVLAGRLDLAQALLTGLAEQGPPGQDAQEAALVEAMEVFRLQPPPGYVRTPQVIPALADAIFAFGQAPLGVQAVEPVRFSPAVLAELTRHWQAWLALARLEAPIPDSAEPDASAPDGPSPESSDPDRQPALAPVRVLALWAFRPAEAAITRSDMLLVHPAGAAGWDLAHLGAWSLGEEGAGMDVARLAGDSARRPVRLCLLAWQGPAVLASLTLSGELTGRDFIVHGSSSLETYSALLAALEDPGLADGHAELHSDEERAAVLELARLLGRDDRLVPAGRLGLRVRDDQGGTDYSDSGQWLAEIVGYVRYGRAVSPWMSGNTEAADLGVFPIHFVGASGR